MEFNDDYIGILLTVCSGYPTIYNKVSNLLYKNFQLGGAELNLLITYMVIMMIKNYPELLQEALKSDD